MYFSSLKRSESGSPCPVSLAALLSDKCARRSRIFLGLDGAGDPAEDPVLPCASESAVDLRQS